VAVKKTIYDFDNYREFLQAAYLELKTEDPKFSFRYFSRVAGFKSSSALKDVINGRCQIAPKSIERFARALKLKKEEAQYFRHLVLLSQAKTLEERLSHAEQLTTFRKLREHRPLAAHQFNYYNRWYTVPVRELVALKDFQEDPEWIARQLNPRITAMEASLALSDLLKLGLIKRDESGRLRQASAAVTTGNEVLSVAISRWHQGMLGKAAESIERHAKDERDISALTVCVSADTVSRLKQMIQTFRKAILEECVNDAGPERVYQLGIQFFPLSVRSKGGT
jgi:uncharacterized protein (TIGR02147 family)